LIWKNCSIILFEIQAMTGVATTMTAMVMNAIQPS
jgi:hypothetical protein